MNPSSTLLIKPGVSEMKKYDLTKEMVGTEMTWEDVFILVKHNRLSFEEFNK